MPRKLKRHPRNQPFYSSLKQAGMSVEYLAGLAGVSRTHLSAVLRNEPGRGGQVRRKVAGFLTEEQRQILGWTSDGKLVNPPENVRPFEKHWESDVTHETKEPVGFAASSGERAAA